MKTLKTAFIICTAFLITSCGSNQQQAIIEQTNIQATEAAAYACPMHPDVVSNQPGSCSKCGMDLVKQEKKQDIVKEYFMQFALSPAKAERGKPVTLSFTPKIKGSESEPVPLDVVHEKKIHLIIVSDDLSYFAHEHPEFQEDGSYTLQHTFTEGGNYFLYADYKPAGGNSSVEKIALTVEGSTAASKEFSKQNLTALSGSYSVTLDPAGGRFATNVLMHIGGIVMKNGKEINANTLENFLGEKAHVVMIGLNDKNYMHVHPSVGANGRFDLHTTFDKPGIYRLWFQFQAEGKLYTLDYTLDVAQATEKDIEQMNEAHSNHHLQEQREQK